jgi:hypothetical protein
VLHVDLRREKGRRQLAVHVEVDERRRPTGARFGLRIVMTERNDLSTAEILAAYRGTHAPSGRLGP